MGIPITGDYFKADVDITDKAGKEVAYVKVTLDDVLVEYLYLELDGASDWEQTSLKEVMKNSEDKAFDAIYDLIASIGLEEAEEDFTKLIDSVSSFLSEDLPLDDDDVDSWE